jgi:D-3-phosphoglycerate dehydrogenase
LNALKSGRLAGAALDVLTGENLENMAGHPLVAFARAHRQLIITPHLGGCTKESMEKAEIFMADKLRSALAHAAPSVEQWQPM